MSTVELYEFLTETGELYMPENKIVINNKKVEQLRKFAGISQKRLGDEIGVSQSGINNLEKGYPLTDGTKQNLRLDSFCRTLAIVK